MLRANLKSRAALIASCTLLTMPATVVVASTSQAATVTSTTATTYYASTNLRASASTSSSIVKKVPAGTKFTGTVSNSWMKISAPSTYAGLYVATWVVRVSTTSTPAPPKTTTPAPVYKLNAPYACTTNPSLPSGATVNCVRSVQYVLNSWLIRNNVPSTTILTLAPGSYGPATTADMKIFQKLHGISATGTMNSATWKALADESASTQNTLSENIRGLSTDTHPAFPSTVKLTDGRLLMVFTSAKQHMNNVAGSMSTWKTYSKDGGYTWSTPQQINLPTGVESTPGAIGIATSGPLAGHPIITTFSGTPGGRQYTMVAASTDLAGNNWGPLTNIEAVKGSSISASPIVQVDDTNFQQAVYVYNGKANTSVRTIGLTYDGTRFIVGPAAVIAATTDNTPISPSKSPTTPTTPTTPPTMPTTPAVPTVPLEAAQYLPGYSTDATNTVNAEGGFSEVGMIKLRDGRLLALIRQDTRTATPGIWRSYSSDGGKNWTPAVRIFDGSGAPRVEMTSDGKLVVLYRHINAVNGAATPSGQKDAVYRVSTDNGATWGAEQQVGVHSAFEMAYGTPIPNADGTVTFVFASEASGSLSNMVTQPNVKVK